MPDEIGRIRKIKLQGSSSIKSSALTRALSKTLSKEDADDKFIAKARRKKTPSEFTRKSKRQQALNQSKQPRTPSLPGENQIFPDSRTSDCRASLRSSKVQKTALSSSSPGRRAVAASRPSGHDLLEYFSSSKHDKSDDGERQTSGYNTVPERLTSKNLKRVARKSDSQRTQPKQWDLINVARNRLKGSKSKQTIIASDGLSKTSSSSKSVSTTSPQFARIAEENGILDRFDSINPDNFNEEFKDFRKRIQLSQNKQGVAQAVISLLYRRTGEGYIQVYDQEFTIFPSNADFNDGLSPAKPDIIEAFEANTFKLYPLIRRLGGSAVPVPGGRPIALAHIAGEFTRLSGDMEYAICQAAYDAATFIYRKQACLAINKPDEAKVACVGTFVSNGDQVYISVYYATNNASGQTVYHHCPIFSDNFLLNHASFALTRKHLRNLQEWAKENATSLKTDLIAHYEASHARTNQHSPIVGVSSRSCGNPPAL